MNLAAVRTGELLGFDFGRGPALLVYCLSGIRELGRGRTAHKQAFDIEAGFFRPWARRIEIESPRHIRVDKRSAPWRCRRVTFPFSLDHRS